MAQTLTVVPIYDRMALNNAIALVCEDFLALSKVGTSSPAEAADYDFTCFVNDLMSQRLLLALVYRQGVYVGFTATRVDVHPGHMPRRVLTAMLAYKRPDAQVNGFMEVVNPYWTHAAQQAGCTEVRLSCSITRLAEVYQTLHGFMPVNTVYRREVLPDEDLQ